MVNRKFAYLTTKSRSFARFARVNCGNLPGKNHFVRVTIICFVRIKVSLTADERVDRSKLYKVMSAKELQQETLGKVTKNSTALY